MLREYVTKNLERKPGEGVWTDYWLALQKDPSRFLYGADHLGRALRLSQKVVAINRAVLWLDGQFEGGNLESYKVTEGN